MTSKYPNCSNMYHMCCDTVGAIATGSDKGCYLLAISKSFPVLLNWSKCSLEKHGIWKIGYNLRLPFGCLISCLQCPLGNAWCCFFSFTIKITRVVNPPLDFELWAAENLSRDDQRKLSHDIKKLSCDSCKIRWRSWHSTRKEGFMRRENACQKNWKVSF